MVYAYGSFLKDLRHTQGFGTAVALWIYCSTFLSAHLIGNKYSCGPIGDLYYFLGLLSLPVLFSLPFIFGAGKHWARRSGRAILTTMFGIVVWVISFLTSEMRFMCKLF